MNEQLEKNTYNQVWEIIRKSYSPMIFFSSTREVQQRLFGWALSRAVFISSDNSG